MANPRTTPAHPCDEGRHKRNVLTNYSAFIFSTKLSTLRLLASDGQWAMLGIIFTEVTVASLVPLKAVFIQLSSHGRETKWTLNVSRLAAYLLLVAYSMLVVSTLFLLRRLHGLCTGLKWDAACIADQIALIRGSNILECFRGLDFATRRELKRVLSEQAVSRGVLRLGYWKLTAQDSTQDTFWHGIALLRCPGCELSIDYYSDARRPICLTRLYQRHLGQASCVQATQSKCSSLDPCYVGTPCDHSWALLDAFGLPNPSSRDGIQTLTVIP